MRASMPVQTARVTLIALWYFAALACVALTLTFYLRGWMEQDTLMNALASINKLYIAYLGVMSAYVYGTRKQVDKKKSAPAAGFWLAIAGSLVWNGILLVLLYRVFLDQAKIEESIKSGSDACSLLSWLVAPAVGYYFASEPKK